MTMLQFLKCKKSTMGRTKTTPSYLRKLLIKIEKYQHRGLIHQLHCLIDHCVHIYLADAMTLNIYRIGWHLQNLLMHKPIDKIDTFITF